MRSYLLSTLSAQARGMDAAAFAQRYNHCWILWEPGPWQPPRDSTVDAQTVHLIPASVGEAVAFPLPSGLGGELSLGRAPTCAIEVHDGTLSSRHLVFTGGGSAWQVFDAGSKNGSQLDGERLSPNLLTRLKSGARLRPGQVLLTFYAPSGMYERLTAGER
jgi:hypothetical protein